MNFRTVADLNRTIVQSLWKVPRDVDLIVGVPRSGMLAGSILALHLNLPLADVDGFLEGRIYESGRHRRVPGHASDVASCRNILVVDDSVLTGESLDEVRRRIREAGVPQEITYAAIYAAPESVDMVDLHFEVCPRPRYFEWNLMHRKELGRACVDIDGVLCCDPTAEENDDGPRYEAFLRDARPLFVPSRPIGTLVTCRLERYRPQTEDWLARNGIRYDRLVMMDLPDMRARQAAGNHGSYKARAYVESKAFIFIESNPRQAAVIAAESGKPVYCLGNHRLYPPPAAAPRALATLPIRAGRKLRRLVRKAQDRLMPSLGPGLGPAGSETTA